jgi:hypothetical protein
MSPCRFTLNAWFARYLLFSQQNSEKNLEIIRHYVAVQSVQSTNMDWPLSNFNSELNSALRIERALVQLHWMLCSLDTCYFPRENMTKSGNYKAFGYVAVQGVHSLNMDWPPSNFNSKFSLTLRIEWALVQLHWMLGSLDTYYFPSKIMKKWGNDQALCCGTRCTVNKYKPTAFKL